MKTGGELRSRVIEYMREHNVIPVLRAPASTLMWVAVTVELGPVRLVLDNELPEGTVRLVGGARSRDVEGFPYFVTLDPVSA